jgi:hypothetical protein
MAHALALWQSRRMKYTIALIIAVACAVALFVDFGLKSADAQSAYNTAKAPLSYELAFGSIAGTGASGATGLVTTTTPCALVAFTNTTNVEIDALIGPSGAVTTKHRVPTGQFHELNLGASNTRWNTGTVVKVFGNGTAPGSGAFEMFCQPY